VSHPKVSVITPTYNRSAFLPLLYACFDSQTYPEKELLILDDSPKPDPYIEKMAQADTRLKYIYTTERLNNGEKRNRLIEMTSGDLIAHFDDDDYYAPTYLETMVNALGRFDLVKLSNWFTYRLNDKLFCYWDTLQLLPIHYKITADEKMQYIPMTGVSEKQLDQTQWGYGFSYVYRKSMYPTVRFEDLNFGSDYKWILAMRAHNYVATCFPDESGLALHMLHQSNVSSIFPQHILPHFLLTHLFGEQVLKYHG
jgi:glycosyltransferase involved in cell wall biosynthesis